MLDVSVGGTASAETVLLGPTLERAAKSGDGGVTTDGARHFNDELLVRLANKGHLYPDATINMACKLAGEKYYADWYGSGMSTLKAIDYGKVSGGKCGSGSHVPPGMMAAKRREDYRAARSSLGAKYRKPVELILLEGQSDLVEVGKAISGSASPHTCRSVAIERFTAGLYMLALHYRMRA